MLVRPNSLKLRRVAAFVRCLVPLRHSATVVIVNWESLHLLRSTITAVRRYSDPTTRIIVVDNGSTDASDEWLRGRPTITSILLPTNVGHGTALDIGFLAARTTNVIALDVDAFPISSAWLGSLLSPLAAGMTVSGAHGGEKVDQLAEVPIPDAWKGRDFVHPCCLAMRLRRFVFRSHTFRRPRASKAARRLDPGETISSREAGKLHFLEPTSTRGPGLVGTVFGEVVYHNFYGTRHLASGGEPIEGIAAQEARDAWEEAVSRYIQAPLDSPEIN